MIRILFAVTFLLYAVAAHSESTGKNSALGQLFDSEKMVLQLSTHLSDGEKATIKTLIPLMAEQMRTPARYYGSIAYAEESGLVSESLQGAFNFHTVASADSAALAACRMSAKTARGSCRLAARILPQGYEERRLTLSQGATAAVRNEYRDGTSSRVFARSASTGSWGFGTSPSEALAACNKGANGQSDCALAIGK